MADSQEYTVKLRIFEGPLDLLLHLIKKNEVDIYDIPIALITDQYLQYLTLMKELNLDIASEYLVMAATLLHIKSRMLLPQPEGPGEEEAEEGDDPRAELVKRLLEYRAFKDAAQYLEGRDILERDVFSRTFSRKEDEDEVLEGVGLFDLVDAFRKVLQNWEEEVSMDVTAERLTIADRISWIAERLRERMEAITFQELFKECTGKMEAIVTFLALLEMIRQRMVKAFQAVQFGAILVVATGG